jgi:hypothetical protein
MALVKKFGTENYLANKMGIGAHDYVGFAYSGSIITSASYYIGGVQDSGELVGIVTYSYDASGNISSIERTS